MVADLLDMLETMAQSGTAPESGCQLFSVGNDEALARLKHTYLSSQFGRGKSAEKFVIGPFGSGKTHFLRQLFEIAEDCNCCFAEVHLNKDVDFTQRLIVYREIARAIRVPNSSERGIKNLLIASLSKVREMLGGADDEEPLKAWIDAIDQLNFQDSRYARQLKRALKALLAEDAVLADEVCRWLEGDVKDKALCKLLGEPAITSAEENLFANRAMFTLFQFIKHAMYAGTVVGFDEAEQGFAVDKKKFAKILSMLQASINAISDLKGGSALILYALTPDLVAEMHKFAALQQRVADPSPNDGFFDGNTWAPKIDLSQRGAGEEDLKQIGAKLVELFFDHLPSSVTVTKEQMTTEVYAMAADVVVNNAGAGNRRAMTKRVCSKLLQVYEQASGEQIVRQPVSAFAEPEV